MDNVIHEHLDNRIIMQNKAVAAVERVVDGLSLDALMANPQAELLRITEAAALITQAATGEAAREGLRFAKAVKKKDAQDKGIEYVDSSDPKLNKGELDANKS